MPVWALIQIFLRGDSVRWTYTWNLSFFLSFFLFFFFPVYLTLLNGVSVVSKTMMNISACPRKKWREKDLNFFLGFNISWLRKPVIIFFMKHACHNLVAEHWISDLWSWWWEQNKSAKISDILICFHFISSIILAVFNLHIFVKLIARAQVSEDLQFLWIFEPHHPYMLISHAYPSFDCLPLSLSPPLL